MSLILDRVGHTYGVGTSYQQHALADVSFAVRPGRLTLVLGPTGSGKSTMLRAAAGLLQPTEGAVRIEGDADAGEKNTRPANPSPGVVGLVFQRPETQLFAETVLEDVAFGPHNLGMLPVEATAAARHALDLVGLLPGDFGSRSPFTLSGGEARRVAIAGVLAMNPRYLLLDEPTAGLDATGRAALHGVIESARATSGIMVVTHDAEEFLRGADDVVILAEGRVRFSGEVAGLLEDPNVFEDAGLRTPGILRTQTLLRERGLDTGPLSFDPIEVAGQIARAMRCFS